jgi:tyrosyl-tRNA synthetase
VQTSRLERGTLGAGAPVADLFVRAGLSASKGEARRDIVAGGAYINNVRSADAARLVGVQDLLFDKYLLLRKGKRSYAVIEVE